VYGAYKLWRRGFFMALVTIDGVKDVGEKIT